MLTESRREYSMREGNASEDRFVNACEGIGYDVRKSSKEEDMYQHIDYWIKRKHKWFGVDVKGNRHPETIWLEFQNVRGREGWLCGKAYYIAFDIVEIGGFAIVPRQDLLEWCRDNIQKKFTTKQDAYKKLYQREGRKDILTKIHLTDLHQIKTLKILRYANATNNRD